MITHVETVTVKYSCPLCRIKNREVVVKARQDENVVEWLEKTCAMAVGEDHMRISPSCQATSISELMIPISGANRVGEGIRQ